jgi:hypothetical protein
MAAATHSWNFFRAGGFDQVKLGTGADLLALDQLDQKLWVALACPTTGLEFDPATLAFIDTDKDGRVRAVELIAAVKWAGNLLKNADDLLKGGASLPLAAISDGTPEGRAILASAKTILAGLGKADAEVVTLADTADTAKIFAQTAFNGDGVIVAESAPDAAIAAVIADILATLGGLPDRSGKPGVDQAKVDAFFKEAVAYDEWVKKSESEAAAVLPLGEATAAASAALRAVRTKVDDFFGRCRLAAFDPRALVALNRDEKEYLALGAKDLTINAAEVAGFPLASVAAGKALPLKTGVNPAWAGAVDAFHAAVVRPLLGDLAELTESDWSLLVAKFAAYDAWLAAKAGVAVEKLGITRVREILSSGAKDTLAALMAKDKALEGEVNAIAAVDKLIRYHRDLARLCRNFVNFADFYGRKDKAIFQAGTLYLDQRSCDLCLDVTEAARHASMAALAGTYLAYLDCVRKGTGEKRSIVAAFTGGDSDNLMVGRNGVFYDRRGLDYDATITKIIENPISIRQAFLSPYKKLIRMIEENIAKRAAAADADANAQIANAAQAAANADKAGATAGKPKPIDVGVIAALSVALGSIGAALGYVLSTLTTVKDWQLPLLFIGVVLAISGPSMLIAYLKLRKRNLGPILDANGWALNARARMNVPFGSSLTATAALPLGAHIDAGDRFAEKRSAWPKILAFLFFVWWVHAYLNTEGYLYRWTEGAYGRNPDKVELKPKSFTLTLPTNSATNAPPAPAK